MNKTFNSIAGKACFSMIAAFALSLNAANAQNYTITNTGGNLVVTDVSGNGEYITLQSNGTKLRVSVSGRNYSLNGGSNTNFPFEMEQADISSITINAGNGNDHVELYSFTNLASLTINGDAGNDGFLLHEDVTFAANANFNLDMMNDMAASDADFSRFRFNNVITTSGTGYVKIAVSNYAIFESGSGIQTENGDLTIEANQGATPTTGNFKGVYLEGYNNVRVTGDADLTIKGKGGTTGSEKVGVYIRTGAVVRGGTSGTVTVVGHGGNDASNNGFQIGVWIRYANTKITSDGADISITGYGGGSGSASYNPGVWADEGGSVTAGGNGSITVYGECTQSSTGGSSSGVVFWDMSNNNAALTTNNGDINVTGVKVNGTGSGHGVDIAYDVDVVAGGSGNININGTGGNSSSNSYGVILSMNGLTASGGNINVTGTTSAGESAGVLVSTPVNTISNGNITVTGTGGTQNTLYSDGVSIHQAISTVNGNITITGTKQSPNNGNFDIVINNTDLISSTNGNVFFNCSNAGLRSNLTGRDISLASNRTTKLNSGSILNVRINGTTAKSNYNPLRLAGRVDVTDALLAFVGSGHSPSPGQVFTIIDNDGSDAVVGTFADLPEGALISDFLGSIYDAAISYVGGTGNDVTVTVQAAVNTWTGNSNTNWHNTANWTMNTVPACGSDCKIPLRANQPIISANAAAGKVTITNGATITINNGYKLEVCKDLVASGSTAIVAGEGALHFTGSTAQAISGSVTANTVRLNNGDGVQFGTGGVLNINTILELEEGTFTTTGGTLRFKSTDENSAAIIDNFSSGFTGNITGNITAERYYLAADHAALHKQHFFSSPVNNVAITQLAPAKGSNGVAVTPKPDCDETVSAVGSNYGNVFEYDESRVNDCHLQGWVVRSSGNTINGKGYSVVKTGTGTLSVNGSPNLGDYSLSGLTNSGWISMLTPQNNTYSSGWHLLGNPYLASLDLDGAANSDFDDAVQVLQTHGAYAGTFQPLSMSGGDLIAPFQGFFAKKSLIGGTVTFNFDNSSRSKTASTFHKKAPHQMSLQVLGNGFADITYFNFNPNATEGYDPQYDGGKMSSYPGQPTLYSVIGAEWASINANANVETTPSIPLGFVPGTTGTFVFQGEGFSDLANTTVILEDKKEGVMHNLTTIPDYTFDADVNDARDRFVLHFNHQAPSSIKESAIDATFNVYPNPASGLVWIKNQSQEAFTAEVFDMQGKRIREIANNEATNGVTSIDISNLTVGIYQLKITSSNGTIVKQLAKQ